jgi:hypothetical protein
MNGGGLVSGSNLWGWTMVLPARGLPCLFPYPQEHQHLQLQSSNY